MEQTLPATCRVKFDNPDQLYDFTLIVTPDEGYWLGGRFVFHLYVTEDYNMAVCIVKAYINIKLIRPYKRLIIIIENFNGLMDFIFIYEMC